MPILVAALLAAASVPAAPGITRQPEVVVTATRRSETVDDTLATVDVLTRADIERLQAADLVQLLARVPGLDVVRTGGYGQTVSVFLRGANSNQLLVLIDGMRVASANTGSFAFEHVPVGAIERVEIVRGPRASWYGADAIGGVIQIFTREREGGAASMRGGRDGRLDLEAGYGASTERGALGVALGRSRYQGYSAQTPDGFSFDPDDDGYDNDHAALDARLALGTQVASANALATRAEIEFDQGVSQVDTDVLALSLAGPLAHRWSHRVALGTTREALSTPAFATDFDSRRVNLDWVHSLTLGDGQELVAGLNWQRERGATIDTFAARDQYRESRRNLALFGDWRWRHGSYDAEFAARYDDNSAYGGETTLQAALARRFGGWRALLSAGEGFRAPTLNELYSPGFDGLFGGNPDLAPERSLSLEAGLDGRLGATALRARAYRTRVRDLIAFQGGDSFRATNIGRARLEGIELDATREFGDYSVAARATWQRAENARSGAELLRRPRRKFGFDVDGPAPCGWRVGASADYVSERQDIGGPLAGYALLALRAERELAHGWRLGLALENAADRDYVLLGGFATPPRALLATLSWEANAR